MNQQVQPWRKRQQVPDAQVLDAAVQYEAAWKLLAAQPPDSGLLLPLMNAAAVAIELYLKCLAAQRVHTAVDDNFFLVSAAPALKSHVMTKLLDEVADDLRQDLEREFQTECPHSGGLSFRDALEKCDGVFAASRYPFEQGTDISKYPLGLLLRSSEFLGRYVANLRTRERIEWRLPGAGGIARDWSRRPLMQHRFVISRNKDAVAQSATVMPP